MNLAEFYEGFENTQNSTRGKFKNCHVLDGINHLKIASGRSICSLDPTKCTNGVTFCLWLKVYATNSNYLYYLSNGGQTTNSYGYALMIKNHLLKVNVKTKIKLFTSQLKESLIVNEWYFMCFFWRDTENVEIFLNGVKQEITIDNIARTSQELFQDFIVGAPNNDVTARQGVGEIDELMFWNRKFSEAEIVDLYQKGIYISSTYFPI